MVIKIKPQPPVPDYKILNAIRELGTPDYQRRIPLATQANVQDTIQALLTNAPARNEFTGTLMNRIGRVIGRNQSWENPMAKFKIGMLEYGDTIEEVMTGLVKAKVYDVNRDYMERDLFGQERPEVQASFHKINRENQYKFTLNEVDLKRAFLSGDEFGLTDFVAQVMSSATKSDNWDEYLLMVDLFRQNYDNGGFFSVNVPNVGESTSDERDSKSLLRRIRAMSNDLKFISEAYNAAHMPVAAAPEDLELIITTEVDAALDVEALASAFNIDRAEVHTRKTVVPAEHINIPGFQAALTTKDFWVVADTHYEVNELHNPAGRYRNYWLQHDQIISLSRFAPTVLFTSAEPSTVITINDSTPTEISEPVVYGFNEDGSELVPVDEVIRGEQYVLEAEVTLDNEDGMNKAVRYGVNGAESYDTRVTKVGGVYVGAQEPADELTFTAMAVGNNTVTSTTVKVVDGDRLRLWPDPEVIPAEDSGEETGPEEG